MNIEIYTFHKTSEKYLQSGMDFYLNKLKFYFKGFQYKEIMLPSSKKTESVEKQLEYEWLELKKSLPINRHIILLDENGSHFSSVDFAKHIEKFFLYQSKSMIFVIGGPYGFHADLKAIANESISLSKMTFTHQMVRLIFLEQLYRAGTILKGEPYHHL